MVLKAEKPNPEKEKDEFEKEASELIKMELKLAEKDRELSDMKKEIDDLNKSHDFFINNWKEKVKEKDNEKQELRNRLAKMIIEKVKEIERLKKENEQLGAMLSGGASRAIGKLGFALGAACLSNTLSEIDIRKDERNKALSELRDFVEIIPNWDAYTTSGKPSKLIRKDEVLKAIDSRRTA